MVKKIKNWLILIGFQHRPLIGIQFSLSDLNQTENQGLNLNGLKSELSVIRFVGPNCLSLQDSMCTFLFGAH